MKNYLVDLHRLRHNPYNGLYTFSCRLAEKLQNHLSEEEQLFYYLPGNKFDFFGCKPSYVAHKRFHKFYHGGTKKFDIWHLTTGISQYRPHNSKTKVIFTIHDVNFLIEEPGNTKRNSRTLKLMQQNIDRADQVVAISKFALDFAAQHLNLKNTPASVIYNGNAVTEFPDFDTPVYRPVKPFLFTLGLVQPRKNLHVLPALLAGNEYELIIAGLNHFDYTQKIIEEARKWKVEDRVKLIGPIDEKDKYWYYKNCEAFIFPSIAEGFGIPPLEAMHFGKPVFLSKFMSLPEIGGDAAFYFNDFDPAGMRKTFDNGMASYNETKPQEKIMQHAAQFSWDKAAIEYLNVYRNLLPVH